MSEETKVIDRIRKMMAMATDERGAENERETAMRMALKLLAKHNLTMQHLEEETEERGKSVLDGRNFPWERTVAFGLAQLYFCKYYFTTKGARCDHNFIGLESNATTALEMSKFVIASVRREGSAYVSRGGPGSHTDFSKGAAARIYARCDALRKQAEAESAAEATPGTSLVLASVYKTEEAANQALLDEMGTKLKQGRNQQRSSNYSAYAAGREFGDRINLNRQVGNGQRTAGLLN
jgi:hypothetical protein